MKKRKIDKQGQPAKCDVCGDIRHEFVMLLVSPDPVEHETWCEIQLVVIIEHRPLFEHQILKIRVLFSFFDKMLFDLQPSWR